MSASVLKIEQESETCSICGCSGDLLTPEEHDACAPPMQMPLRAMLLHLNNNKVVPDGRLCSDCIRRAVESYEFSTSLASKGAPPLSDKIRALRRRLHELTQRIDVFIVVGGPGVGAGGAYGEDDIIAVERDALAAAAAADDEDADAERAQNARGDSVYQCSVCPRSFVRAADYRAHCAGHPADALHSCWTCGAQAASRAALRRHAAEHEAPRAPLCQLCGAACAGAAELRRHEAACAAACPACGQWAGGRAALARHALAAHARSTPALCPACFRRLPSPAALAAHLLRHRQARHYVCGYDGCILRFGTRGNLMSHIRKCHAAAAPEPAAAPTTCPHCARTFGSVAAMKRHLRVHKRADATQDQGQEEITEYQQDVGLDMELGDGEVEYLEVETLDEGEYRE